MNMSETMEKPGISEKKTSRRKVIISAIVLLFLAIVALIFIYFTQQNPKSDPASEKIFREAAAAQLTKDPNELIDEDFALITELRFPINKGDKIFASGNYIYRRIELIDIKILEKFINLQYLALGFIAYPENKIPIWMKLLGKFGIVDLSQRYSIDLRPIEKLTNLRELLLNGLSVTNIKPIKALTNLRLLSLRDTDVSDIEPIRNLKKLETLDIAQTKVAGLEPIRNLSNLQQLSLDGTKISDLEPLKGLVKLRNLDLRGCANITDEQAEGLQKSLPNLKIYR